MRRTESFTHLAVPYDSDDQALRLIRPHLRQALEEGRRTLVIASLPPLGPGVERRDPREWYEHPHRALAALCEYAKGQPTLVVGQPPEGEAWIRYDSVLNAALRGYECIALCLFRREPRHALLTHPAVLDDRGVRRSDSYVEPHELVLAGERAPLPEPEGEVRVARFGVRAELATLRRAVADYARAAGMDRNLIPSLVLSVSEVAANSVEHGAGHGTVKMWTNGREVVCEIADPGGSLADPLPGYLPPEPGSQRGYGLWISRQLCDLVEVRSGRDALRVRLHMRLS
ncbi:ATP-binding protein [Thermoactinospora rubra]|uniref:ATP-binding protein n=1 Tax=Thermoactinospora rubra TaxID=1088767 RepID=UPI000A11ECE8|nr:ATP-binding protein [Thermoactinospora rubra]